MNNALSNLTLSELNDFFVVCIEEQIPLIVKGSPGIGKSQTIAAWCKAQAWSYLDFIPSFAKPSQLGGIQIPDIKNNKCEFLYINLLESIFNAKVQTVVHIQDLLQAPDTIAKQIMSLIEFRCVNGRAIPECVSFVLDTNEANHRAGTGTILGTTNNRCAIVTWPRDVKGWITWGLQSGRICKEIILFIHANPELLYSDDVPRGFTPYNTPRSWEKLSKVVSKGFVAFPFVESLVGAEAASRFVPFYQSLQEYGNLIAKIKKDPMDAPLFDTHSADKILGAVFILSNHFEKGNVNNFLQYITRYNNNEYTKLLIELGCQTHPDSKETKAYVDHITTAKGGK